MNDSTFINKQKIKKIKKKHRMEQILAQKAYLINKLKVDVVENLDDFQNEEVERCGSELTSS